MRLAMVLGCSLVVTVASGAVQGMVARSCFVPTTAAPFIARLQASSFGKNVRNWGGSHRIDRRPALSLASPFQRADQSITFCGRITALTQNKLALSMSSSSTSVEDDTEEERMERNELLIEAYAELAEEIKSGSAKSMSVVEVALDAPAKWWTEVVVPRLQRIADAGDPAPGKRVLDVGTGTGTIIGLVCSAGKVNQEDVVGVDLCEEMLEIAEEKYPDAVFVQSDFLDLELEDLDDEPEEGQEDSQPAKAKPFDAVYFNAVFGSLPDQTRALSKAADLCSPGGRIVIGHPLGAAFVASLHETDDVFTPSTLPGKDKLEEMVKYLPLAVSSVEEEEEFYLASLRRTPHSVMPDVIFMRGPVATGYGRGGKKLGVPTANLPQSLFSGSLASVPAGVYCGWASVEQSDGSTSAVKAVVNVGYSPTFVGEENREKIVEAHLMGYEGGDFYGSEMRLMLVGHQRGEKKFGSFPELIAAINQDITDAKAALDTPPLSLLSRHPYLRKGSGMATWMVSPHAMALNAAKL